MFKADRLAAFGIKSLAAPKIRDFILLGIGMVLGAIILLPFQNSTSEHRVIPSVHSTSPVPLSSKPKNAYNARIISNCPISPEYSTGSTQLICSGPACERNYTRFGPPKLNQRRVRKIDKMKSHKASILIEQYPLAIDILDIGANTGHVSSIILSQAIGHRILAVEPVEKNLNYICRTAQLNSWLGSRLTIVHAAVSDRIDKERIFVPIGREDNAAISTNAATKNVDKPKRGEDIFLLDGDGLLQETGFKPKFIKIDTQGHELFVLKGLKQYLKNAHKGEVIVMAELDYGLTEASGVDIMDVYKLMIEELGYSASCKADFEFDENGFVLRSKGIVLTKDNILSKHRCGDAFYVKL